MSNNINPILNIPVDGFRRETLFVVLHVCKLSLFGFEVVFCFNILVLLEYLYYIAVVNFIYFAWMFFELILHNLFNKIGLLHNLLEEHLIILHL